MNTYFKQTAYGCLFLFSLLCCNLIRGQEGFYVSPGSQMAIDSATIFTSIGNITLDQGAEFVHNGTLYLRNTVTGSSWIDRNSNFSGLGLVIFQGVKEITYTGNSTFHNLTVNGAPVNLTNSGVLNVFNQLLLQLGVINTGAGSSVNVVSQSADAITAHASNMAYSKSYINGVLKRSIAANQLTYDFPVGNSGDVHLLSFMNHLLTGVNSLTASFGAKQGTDLGIKEANVSSFRSVNPNGVWFLKPEGTANGGTYGLRLSLQGFTGLVDNGFGILARPLNSSKGEDWIIPTGSLLPQAGTSGRTITSGFSQLDNINSFDLSQFGIGMSSLAASLPDIRVFPNPTAGILNISLPVGQEYTLIVFNDEGKMLLQQKMIQTSQIRLSKFHPGMYTLSLFNSGNKLIVTRKIMLIK
ncbi:MAG: T9SS type A sorting domain-containing protein [Chitinophagaceae bacterium]